MLVLLVFQVRLVKCLIDNIIVDISFNQMGGLCTLCFLELVCRYELIVALPTFALPKFMYTFVFSLNSWSQVDRHIGKDHLFKRSIILIKAWCYYESRILGAHHGLISTYALETLVLYIFNLFHKTMDGPLAVSRECNLVSGTYLLKQGFAIGVLWMRASFLFCRSFTGFWNTSAISTGTTIVSVCMVLLP